MSYFLDIEVIQGDDGIFIHQRKFATEFLKKFKMEDSNPVKTPIEIEIKLAKEGDGRTVDATYFKQIVGSLRYLTCTRPDICYVVGFSQSIHGVTSTSSFTSCKENYVLHQRYYNFWSILLFI